MNTFYLLLSFSAVFCLSFVAVKSCSQSVEIRCDGIGPRSYWTLGWFSTCYLNNTTKVEFSNAVVTSVIDSDNLTITDTSNIRGIFLNGLNAITRVRFFPRGLKTKFPSLIAVNITGSTLISIGKKNLQEFGSTFEVLDLSFNLLTFIGANLFVHNPNIKYVGLNGNPLRYIEPAFFKNMLKLQSLDNVNLNSVTCMSQQLIGRDIKGLKFNYGNCSDKTAKNETKSFIKNGVCITKTTPTSATIASIKYLVANFTKTLTDIFKSNPDIQEKTPVVGGYVILALLSGPSKPSFGLNYTGVIVHWTSNDKKVPRGFSALNSLN